MQLGDIIGIFVIGLVASLSTPDKYVCTEKQLIFGNHSLGILSSDISKTALTGTRYYTSIAQHWAILCQVQFD